MPSFDYYRAEFGPTAHMAYLNHAGVAPLSARVATAMNEVIAECAQWGAFNYSTLWGVLERTRKLSAGLLQTTPERIAFIKNTSEGISFVAQGYPWKAGDAVVLPEGEFPSNVYPWLNLEARGVQVLRVPLRDGRLLLEDFVAQLDKPNVRMLAVSSVEYGNGFANDLAALGKLCAERDIFFFVDAIQSLGWAELYPQQLGIHALAADAHKWLMGPEGCGIFYLSESAQQIITPLEVGWNSVTNPFDFAATDFTLKPDASRFECGSYSLVLVRGMEAALELLLEVGLPAINKRVMALSDHLVDGLLDRGVRLLSSRRQGEASPIVTFDPTSVYKECSAQIMLDELIKRDVYVAARGGGVRVAPHFYNTEVEIDSLLTAVDEILHTVGGRR
jgi:selenocysteine lyase/cysteine desulfurase